MTKPTLANPAEFTIAGHPVHWDGEEVKVYYKPNNQVTSLDNAHLIATLLDVIPNTTHRAGSEAPDHEWHYFAITPPKGNNPTPLLKRLEKEITPENIDARAKVAKAVQVDIAGDGTATNAAKKLAID